MRGGDGVIQQPFGYAALYSPPLLFYISLANYCILTSTLLLDTNGESGGDELGDMSTGLGRCEEASKANASTPADEGEMLCPAAAIICCRMPCATAATAAAAEFGDTGPSTDWTALLP